MSMGLAGQLANRGGKYLFSAAIAPPNLCVCRGWRVRRVATSSLVLHDDRGREELKHTIILSQNGRHIQELPVIVRRAKMSALCEDEGSSSEDDRNTVSESQPDEQDLKELHGVLKSCRTLKHLLELVWDVPANELTPVVSVEILRKLIELENNQHYRRKTPPNGGAEDRDKNSSRDAIVCSLLETVVASNDPKLILESLKIITRDMSRAASRNNNSWVGYYRERLSHEALILATDSKFLISELCEIVHAFSYIYKDDADLIDLLWVGFEAKAGDIDPSNIVEVFRTLPLFKKSRKVVLGHAEIAFLQVCWSLNGAAIAEIMAALQACKEVGQNPSDRLLAEISNWIATNIDAVSEAEVVDIVAALCGLDYNSPRIVQSLEKYVKTHNKSPELFANIMEYCSKFRLRSPTILEACAVHVISNSTIMSPVVLKSIFSPYGLLYYHPIQSASFLDAIEKSFSENFVRFRPEDAADIVLAFIFLRRYPVQFVSKIFNSNFLDRLDSCQNEETIRSTQTKLKLFDMAMTLDCDDYNGPLLPRETNVRSMWVDKRLTKVMHTVIASLEKSAGSRCKISQFVLMSGMPAVSLYIVDILLHPSSPSPQQEGRLTLTQEERKSSIAFLIHVPEHYCAHMDHLTGPQELRHHHFQKLGLSTVKLRYDLMNRYLSHPRSLDRYLQESLRAAREKQAKQ
ncbi:FAST kinase domain-containing protein 3, mitochondrial [Frankliniella fusca]|uniref:FAST kinase domain-containing protein 3, mitochondrial n=1 Tax=Frankliniella fusca TaxID=407009 RepID=A0AAE1H3C3_9NEOP|nr:FAST kinase domain-containing protein 3, mitochondrial [Frankliniella fusca]